LSAVSASWMELDVTPTVSTLLADRRVRALARRWEPRRAGSRGPLESDRPQATQIVAGDLASDLSAVDVGEAEVDPFPDACVDDLSGDLPPASVDVCRSPIGRACLGLRGCNAVTNGRLHRLAAGSAHHAHSARSSSRSSSASPPTVNHTARHHPSPSADFINTVANQTAGAVRRGCASG
jgi:hypothetical protein